MTIAIGLLALFLSLAVSNMLSASKGTIDWYAVFMPNPDVSSEILLHYTLLPRIVVGLMAGAALGAAGTILQGVLRNPLAEPTTLGISGGSYLALTVATLWMPALAATAPEWVSLAGAGLALAAILALCWRTGLSPAAVTLSGMIVSLYCGAASAVCMLFNHDFLTGIYVWGAGYLDQQDWSGALFLLPRLAAAGLAAWFIQRPLTLLALDDASATSAGLSLQTWRLVSLGIASALIATVVASAGVISFIGLAAPIMARASGARSSGRQMAWAALFGALLLAATDQCVQALPLTYRVFPTGAVTALMGAPLMLFLVPKLKSSAPTVVDDERRSARLDRPGTVLGAATAAAVLLLFITILAGEGPDGWQVLSLFGSGDLAAMRLTRSLAAFAGGAMLALAGAILQRMTGNLLASPEVLGVSSGAMLGVIAATLSATAAQREMQVAAGVAGAAATLALLLALARFHAFRGERLLLIGVTLSSVSGFVMTVVMAAQDPRLEQLLAWMAGSTYAVRPAEALASIAILGFGLAATILVSRWLELLPLGSETASSVGMPTKHATGLLLALSAVLTAAATILVGPLSFAGLMGPHLARLAGFQRAAGHMAASALVGGMILVCAEWLGRNLIFPFQIPAGLLATVVGGPFLLLFLRRQS